MATSTYILIGITTIAIILTFIAIGIYNSLVKGRNYFKNSYAQIDVQLKRRYDLIPNLIETAKAFMAHEKETLEAVIQARNSAQKANSHVAKNPSDTQAIGKLAAAEGALSNAMGSFFALSESYPDLKSDTHMEKTMEELTSTENKISFARQAFNDSVTSYNNARESFPAVMFADGFGFKAARLLEVIESPKERKAVKVSF